MGFHEVDIEHVVFSLLWIIDIGARYHNIVLVRYSFVKKVSTQTIPNIIAILDKTMLDKTILDKTMLLQDCAFQGYFLYF